MTAYWIVFAIMFLLQFIKVNTKKEYLWKLVISFIPLFIFGAFRVNFGYDYEAYQSIFDLVKSSHGQYDGIRAEIGYLKLNELMPTFRILLIVTTTLTCTSYIFLFYKIIPEKYSWLAIILLFLSGDKTIFFMFSGIRNAISISILIFTIPLLEKRKLLPYMLCMILASLFHKTAFIYFPLAYFVSSNKNITRKEIFIWSGIFSFFFIFSHMTIMNTVESLLNTFFSDRYSSYVEQIEDWGDKRGILIRIATVLLFIPAMFFCNKHSFSTLNNVVNRLGLMYIISTTMGSLNMRTSHHFIMFFLAFVISIYANSKNRLLKYGYMLFVIAYLSYAFFVVYLGSPTFPYDVYESTIFGLIE